MTATPHRSSVRIDDDVEWLTEQITALNQLGAREDVSEEERYDFSIRWGTALAGRLRRLVHYSSLGELDEADQRRYASLRDELQSLSGLIDRFGLARPVFTDLPPATAKRHAGGQHAKTRHERRRPD